MLMEHELEVGRGKQTKKLIYIHVCVCVCVCVCIYRERERERERERASMQVSGGHAMVRAITIIYRARRETSDSYKCRDPKAGTFVEYVTGLSEEGAE